MRVECIRPTGTALLVRGGVYDARPTSRTERIGGRQVTGLMVAAGRTGFFAWYRRDRFKVLSEEPEWAPGAAPYMQKPKSETVWVELPRSYVENMGRYVKSYGAVGRACRKALELEEANG